MFKVAIVGRTNVGKSTLFNRLVRARRAIVGDQPGITRDRLYGTAQWNGVSFMVIDTGGLIPGEVDLIPALVREQTLRAIQESDLLLFTVDARSGVTPLDEELARMLRAQTKPVLLVVNKVDSAQIESLADQFYALGWDKIFPISAEHNIGIGEVLDEIARHIASGSRADVRSPEATSDQEIRVAIVGRPNVGKSLLVNRMVGTDRMIVSQLPGTTRDAVDTILNLGPYSVRIIDTAGIRRRGKTKALAEKLSVIMARKHLEAADVALVVIDATEPATKLDATIAGYAHEAGCSVILVVNKWDLVKKGPTTYQEYVGRIRYRMRFLDYAPMVTVSALTGLRVRKLFDHIIKAAQARKQRVPTGELNEFFHEQVKEQVLSAHPSRKFEVKYLTQGGIAPPTFIVFTSTPDKLHFSTERFIINRIRERFGFYATPIRIIQRTKKR